jgi:ribosome-associated protein
MDIRKLQRAIVDGLEDVKAQHIVVFNTEHLSSMFERVIIASGTSNRQTKALAASVRDAVKSRGMQVMATEGEDNGEWIIVDCGAAVAHIMQPGIREYYHLEEIWGGKSVRMKVGEANTRLVKASEPEPAPRRAAARSATAAPPKPAARAAAAPSKAGPKTPARKAADKSAAYQRVVGKAPARKPAAGKAAAGTPVARKAAAKKITARKVRRVT